MQILLTILYLLLPVILLHLLLGSKRAGRPEPKKRRSNGQYKRKVIVNGINNNKQYFYL